MSEAKNEKELKQAMETQVSEIEITGDLAHRIIWLRVSGRLAWFIAIVALIVGICGYLGETQPLWPSDEAKTLPPLSAFLDTPPQPNIQLPPSILQKLQNDPAATTRSPKKEVIDLPWQLAFIISFLAALLGVYLHSKCKRYRLVQKAPGKVILQRK